MPCLEHLKDRAELRNLGDHLKRKITRFEWPESHLQTVPAGIIGLHQDIESTLDRRWTADQNDFFPS